MAEPVEMPGFAGLIVTRHDVYHWFRRAGYDLKARGFASVDYQTFARPVVKLPLTEPAERDRLLRFMLDDVNRHG